MSVLVAPGSILLSFPCSCTSWELPGEVPLETTRKLIERFTKEWSEPSAKCFEGVYDTSSAYIQTLVTQRFGQFKPLETHVRFVVRVFCPLF